MSSRAMDSLGEWFKERFPIQQETLVELGSEPVPGHLKRWWWCIGGTPAYLFLVQVVTGILLTFYYVPTPEQLTRASQPSRTKSGSAGTSVASTGGRPT